MPISMADPILRNAVPLIGQKNNRCQVVGSAILIAPNWGITAKHVIDEYASWEHDTLYHYWQPDNIQLRNTTISFVTINQDSSINEFGLIPHRLHSIHKVFVVADSDIALFNFSTLSADYDHLLVGIDFRPPNIGERVWAAGYPNSSVQIDFNEQAMISSIYLNPTRSAGLVVEVFPERFSEHNPNYPLLVARIKCDHGMSGGPVFNGNTGRLIGMVTSGLPGHDRFGAEEARLSLLAPLLRLSMRIDGQDLEVPFVEFLNQSLAGKYIEPVNDSDYEVRNNQLYYLR